MWLRRADTSLAQTFEKHSQPGKLVPRYIDQQGTGLFDEQTFSSSLCSSFRVIQNLFQMTILDMGKDLATF